MVSTTLALKSIATAAFVGMAAAAEDVLYSSRALSKRFVDSAGNYNMSFYHINDVHAHLDQFSSSGTDCTNPSRGCFGGYARVKTVLDATRPSHKDSLLLNVGDEFQGTFFYSYYKGEKIAVTLNQMGFDGMTIGNHEFDGGDEQLGDFLKNLTFPVISANIVSDNAKLNSTIKPFHIYPQHNLAVIGVTTETTADISSPGKGTKFLPAIETVQNTIDFIKKTTSVTRIAAITHIGYDQDIELAKRTKGLHLIMGGHSHTLLGDMAGAAGKYPTIEKNQDGDEVFIVTAYRWGEYLGYIDVTYDPAGKILAYHGAPMHLTNATAQDAAYQAQVNEWRKPFEEFAKEIVGSSKVVLDQTLCQKQECLLGDFIADAMLDYRLDNGAAADFALTNAGGIRATIDAGDITRGAVLTAFPFGNAVVELKYTGAELLKIFEGIVSKVNQYNGKTVTSFLQISRNIKLQYNPDGPVGSRLVSLAIGGQPVDASKTYTMVSIDFIANGGDSFLQPVAQPVVLNTLDEVLVSYIKKKSPVDIALDGRIAAVSGGGGNSTTTSSTASFTNSTMTRTATASSTTGFSNSTMTGTATTATGSATGTKTGSVSVSVSGSGSGGMVYPTGTAASSTATTKATTSAIVYSTGSSSTAKTSASSATVPSGYPVATPKTSSSSSASAKTSSSPISTPAGYSVATPSSKVSSTSAKTSSSSVSVPVGYSAATPSSKASASSSSSTTAKISASSSVPAGGSYPVSSMPATSRPTSAAPIPAGSYPVASSSAPATSRPASTSAVVSTARASSSAPYVVPGVSSSSSAASSRAVVASTAIVATPSRSAVPSVVPAGADALGVPTFLGMLVGLVALF